MEANDGMNGSIISYNIQSSIMLYSGAYNPLYLIRDDNIIEYKADRMPLAYYEEKTDFSLKEIKVLPNDMVYLFTDGFIDQFGGQDVKKFKSGQFKETLLRYHKHPLQIQKQMLLETYNSWKGNSEQIDDITIVGLKF